MYIKEQQAKARQLSPSMQVGKSGVTPGLIKELKAQLKVKKLIKLRFMKSFSDDKNEAAKEIAKKIDGVVIQHIGNVFVFAKKRKINK